MPPVRSRLTPFEAAPSAARRPRGRGDSRAGLSGEARRWSAGRLEPAGPHRQAPRGPAFRPRMSRHRGDDAVVIEAEQVTVTGTPEDVEAFAVAAGLYGEPTDASRMSKDEDHIMTGVYIGIGLLVAA